MHPHRRQLVAALTALDTQAVPDNGWPTQDHVDWLAALPVLRLNLATAPQPLQRRLFEAAWRTLTVSEGGEVSC